MNISTFQAPKIKQFKFTFIYEPLNVDRLIYKFEDNIGDLFDHQQAVMNKNGRDAQSPINVANFLFRNQSGKVFEVSPIEARLIFTDMELNKSGAILKDNIVPIFNFLNTLPELNLENFSATIQLQYPLKDIDYHLPTDLFETFIKIDKPEKLNSVSFMFEEIVDDLSFSYAFGHYEELALNVPIENIRLNRNENSTITLDDQNYSIVERGLNKRITIRKHGLVNDNTSDSYSKVYSKAIAQIKEAEKSICSRS